MGSNLKVVMTRMFLQSDVLFLKNALPNVEFIQPETFDEEGITAASVSGVDVFLGPPPEEAVLRKFSQQIKLIQIPWTGLENIDFSVCKSMNLVCANSHGNSLVVAEMALGLLLSILKGIPFHDSELRINNWHRPNDPNGFYPPIKLSDKTVGYFGYGAINQSLNRLLQGFDIKRIACVTQRREIDGIDSVYSQKEFFSFLNEADIVVIAAPLTTITAAIFSADAFKNMKRSSILINVARAGIVDEAALYEALASGEIAGAALDVWYKYPGRLQSVQQPSELPFHSHRNVVMSPHRAGYSQGELPHLDDVVENIKRLERGDVLINRISFLKSY